MTALLKAALITHWEKWYQSFLPFRDVNCEPQELWLTACVLRQAQNDCTTFLAGDWRPPESYLLCLPNMALIEEKGRLLGFVPF